MHFVYLTHLCHQAIIVPAAHTSLLGLTLTHFQLEVLYIMQTENERIHINFVFLNLNPLKYSDNT